MASELFSEYYQRCFDRIEKSLDKFEKEPDPVHLFKFRTSVKKIRVCLACIEYYSNKKLTGIRARLRKYFYENGKVRDTGMYRDWLHRHHFSALEKLMELDKGYKEKAKEFAKQSGKILDDIKQIRKKVDHAARHIGQEKAGRFFIELLHANLPLPFGHPPRRRWHAKRKNLKRIVYARHWQEGDLLKLVSKRQADWMNRLQHLFGEWHDNEEMIAWMRDQATKQRSHGQGERFSLAIRKMKDYSAHKVRLIDKQLAIGARVLGPLQKRMEKYQGLH